MRKQTLWRQRSIKDIQRRVDNLRQRLVFERLFSEELKDKGDLPLEVEMAGDRVIAQNFNRIVKKHSHKRFLLQVPPTLPRKIRRLERKLRRLKSGDRGTSNS